MYLEISGRRSGKTTRLVKDVIKNITSGINVVVVVIDDLHMIEITDEQNYAGSFDCVTYKDYILDWSMYDNHKFYFDEFDFMSNDIPVLEDGYYCTTPKKMRSSSDVRNLYYNNTKDVLLSLLEANGFFYKKYAISPEAMKQFSYSHHYTDDLYHRECLGNFFCEVYDEEEYPTGGDIDCDPYGPDGEYQENHEWIVKTAPDDKTKKNHDCECDMSTLILYGCKCGAITKKRN